MAKVKEEFGNADKRSFGAITARMLTSEQGIGSTKNKSQVDTHNPISNDSTIIDLSDEGQEDPDFEQASPEVIMRFYNSNGTCYVCDTKWPS